MQQKDQSLAGLNTSKTVYRKSENSDMSSAGDWQSSNVFGSLSTAKTYYFQSQVTDNCGNTTTSQIRSQTTVAKSITVYFHPNGGSGTDGQAQTFTYGVANQSFAAKNFSRTGYTQGKWAESSSGSGVYDITSGVADSWIESKYNNTNHRVDLYATWKASLQIGDIGIGDTVQYTPGTAPTDSKMDAVLSGVPASSATNGGIDIPTTTTSNLTWEVLSKDTTNNTITITPTTPTTETITMKGADGYNNAVQVLNAYCKKHYSNAKVNAVARSLNIDDIEQYYTDGMPKTAQDLSKDYESYLKSLLGKYYTASAGYGNSLTPSNKQAPTIYARGYNNDNTKLSYDPQEIIKGINTSGITSAVKETFYRSKDNATIKGKLNNDKIKTLLFDNYKSGFLLASRSVNVRSLGAGFDVRYVSSDGSLNANSVVTSGGLPYSITSACRPAVSIPISNIAKTETANVWKVQ